MRVVLLPAQAFLPDCPIEALYVGLLILTVRSGYTVTVTEEWHIIRELCLKLRPTISL